MTIPLVNILKNEWADFEKSSGSSELQRHAVKDNIWKVMHCKTSWMGLQIHHCKEHPHIVKVVPNTCKSRFCPSCGFKANLIWLNDLLKRVLPCNYQHLVFSLPYELRDLAKNNRRLIFNLMSQSLTKAITTYINEHKNLQYTPGIVTVLHTFGKGLKWHIHFHVLITAGGLRDNKWVNNSYLNETFIKKAYKALMLKGLRKLHKQGKLIKAVGKHPGQSFRNMLAEIYKKDWHTWIDYARDNGIVAFQYIGRYCKRACISQKGIVEYRPGKLVRWKERGKVETPDICANRKTPHEFLNLLIQHIPDHYVHQVHYYGLYSSRNKKLLHVAYKIFKKKIFLNKVKSVILSSFNKMLGAYHDYEPLTCPLCNKTLILTGILFFNIGIPADKDILLNYAVKNYDLVAIPSDSS